MDLDLVSDFKRTRLIEGDWEKDTEENIWTQESGSAWSAEKNV
jgi:hypothetical protein